MVEFSYLLIINVFISLLLSASSTNAIISKNIHAISSEYNDAAKTLQREAVITTLGSASSQNLDTQTDAFSAYMTKSHKQKLKAIKDVEDNKNTEIKDLKRQIAEMEELSAKLSAYKKFMKDYIVNAQTEKYNAVKAAEAAISQKYEGKLNSFMLDAAANSSYIAVSAVPVAATTATKKT